MEKIEAVTAQINAAIAADDLEQGIELSAAMWELSFATNCNQCRGAAYAPLETLRVAVLDVATKRPAYEAAGLLKLALDKQFCADNMTNRDNDLRKFKNEVAVALKSVEAKAKPEIIAQGGSA